MAGREDPASRETNLQFIMKRGTRARADLFQLQEPGILDALNMKGAALRNLAQMNLHA
jgi:hypothetical protein